MTTSDREADAFFVRYLNPNPETIAALQQEAHPDGDIEAVVAEADHYWDSVVATRAAHVRSVLNSPEPFAHRNEAARRPYTSPEALSALPAPAYERQPYEVRSIHAIRARVFWGFVSKRENRDRVAAKARAAWERGTVNRERARKAAERRAALAHRQALLAAQRQQRLEQTLRHIGAIHAAREAKALRAGERRLRTEIHPAGLTIERALEIAMSVLPPQEGR